MGFWDDERSTRWSRLLDARDAYLADRRERAAARRRRTGTRLRAAADDPRITRGGGIGAITCGVGLFVIGTLVTPLAGADVDSQRTARDAPLTAVHASIGAATPVLTTAAGTATPRRAQHGSTTPSWTCPPVLVGE